MHSVSSHAKRLLLLAMVVLLNASVGCAPKDRSDYFYRYYYHPVLRPAEYLEITSGNISRWIRIIHIYQDGAEVSPPYAKRYHFFHMPGPDGLHFAIPVSRSENTLTWRFKGCVYEVLERRTGLTDENTDPETNETYSIIHGACPDKDFEMRYGFAESRGLLGFATGRTKLIDGREVFIQEDPYIGIGLPGFGLRWSGDE